MALVLTLVAGCAQTGAPIMPQGAAFRLDPAGPLPLMASATTFIQPDDAVAAVASPRRGDTAPPVALATTPNPTPPATDAGGERRASGGHHAAPPSRDLNGVLTVDLRGFLAALRPAGSWRLLNTVADIATISLTVIQGGVTTASATLSQTDIANDAVTRTFNGLPTGNAVVLVVAYDALGAPIGSASQVVVVSAAGTSVANLAVQLVPSSPAPGPGNTLAANLTFSPASGTVLAVFPMGNHNLLAAGDGYLYAEGMMYFGNPPAAWLGRFSPTDGSELQTYLIDTAGPGGTLHGVYPLAYNPVSHSVACGAWASQEVVTQPGDTSVTAVNGALRSGNLMVDAAGVIYYPRGGSTLEAFEAGAVRTTNIPCYSAADIDTAGTFWSNLSSAMPPAWPPDATIAHHAADGSLMATYAMPFPPGSIKSAGAGGVWVTDQGRGAGTQIVHVAGDGAVGAPITAPIADFCVDANGNLWLAETTSLVKLTPDGTVAGTFPIPAIEVTAGFGYVFAGTYVQGTGTFVHKIVP